MSDAKRASQLRSAPLGPRADRSPARPGRVLRRAPTTGPRRRRVGAAGARNAGAGDAPPPDAAAGPRSAPPPPDGCGRRPAAASARRGARRVVGPAGTAHRRRPRLAARFRRPPRRLRRPRPRRHRVVPPPAATPPISRSTTPRAGARRPRAAGGHGRRRGTGRRRGRAVIGPRPRVATDAGVESTRPRRRPGRQRPGGDAARTDRRRRAPPPRADTPPSRARASRRGSSHRRRRGRLRPAPRRHAPRSASARRPPPACRPCRPPRPRPRPRRCRPRLRPPTAPGRRPPPTAPRRRSEPGVRAAGTATPCPPPGSGRARRARCGPSGRPARSRSSSIRTASAWRSIGWAAARRRAGKVALAVLGTCGVLDERRRVDASSSRAGSAVEPASPRWSTSGWSLVNDRQWKPDVVIPPGRRRPRRAGLAGRAHGDADVRRRATARGHRAHRRPRPGASRWPNACATPAARAIGAHRAAGATAPADAAVAVDADRVGGRPRRPCYGVAPRGRGSAGRASPCQGEGRGFESRRPLHRNRWNPWPRSGVPPVSAPQPVDASAWT